jgi:hypothetical protein
MNPWLLAAWLVLSPVHAQDEQPADGEQLSEPSGSGPADSAPAVPDPGEEPAADENAPNPTKITGISAASGDADASAEGAQGVGSGDYYSADELASGPGADSVRAAPAGAAKPAKAGKGRAKAAKPAAAKAPKMAKAAGKAEPKKPAAPAAPLAIPLTPVAPFNP